MHRQVLLDTGSLVALLNRRDNFHEWAKLQWKEIEPPLLTCEPVIAEACFLLQNVHGGQEAIMSLIETDVIQISFSLKTEIKQIKALLLRYRSVPMSLADGCLVRMAELSSNSSVLTLDSDFRIYRKYKNQIIPLIIPENR